MNIVQGSSGVTYSYPVKQDFFGLRIVRENNFSLQCKRLVGRSS